MMRELFLRDLSLWACLWQSTAFAAFGLIAGWLLRHRPARAYQVLLLAMTTAVAVPLLSAVVKHLDLGAFVARPTELSYALPEVPFAMSDTAPDAGAMPDTASDVGATRPAALQSMPAAVVEPTALRIPWQMVLRYGWLAVTLALLARLVATFLYGVHLVRHASPVPRGRVQRAVDSAESKLAISWGLKVRASRRIHSPLVWCWSRPSILLVPAPCDDAQVDWAGVVAHELAHCQRRDHITGLVAELAASLLPWNPLMWLSRRMLIRLGEQACDDWVVASGQSSEDYAESLLHFRPQKQPAFWPAVVSSQGGLARRIRRILNDACGNPRAGARWALTVGIAALGIGLGVAFAQTRPAVSEASTKPAEQPALSLHEAAAAGNLEQVDKLLAQGADLNEKDKDGWTPLHHAAWCGRKEVATVLLSKGANVNATNATKGTPLHLAARFGARFVPELLLAKGADVRARNEAGNTPLHVAAGWWSVDEDLLELLIEKGADVKARNETAQTPLHLAAASAGRRESEQVLEFLLAHGADVNAQDKDSRTPLHMAAANTTHKRKETVEFLLNKGAHIEAKNAAGATALHVAATNRSSSDIVELLLNRGADVNSVNPRGMTPLHLAARRGHDEIVERLIAKGANVNAKAAHGETPALLAANGHLRDTVTLLLSKGADISSIQLAAYVGDLARVKAFLANGVGVNTQDPCSVTPLHAAALGGHKEVAEFLLSKGALVNTHSAAYPIGVTPLHCAAAALAGSKEVAELLIGKGAEIHAKTEAGYTPLGLVGLNNIDTARLLIAHGADVNAKARNDYTPLHRAAQRGGKDLVLLLLDHGADMNARMANGAMPSALAAQQGHEDVVRLLIDKGADLSNRDDLLFYACQYQQKDLAELLIRKGADVNSRAWGYAPAMQAMFSGNTSVTKPADIPKLIGILKLLLDNGADPDAKDGYDWSLLHYACGEEFDLAKMLLDKGANPNAVENERGFRPLHLAADGGRTAAVELLIRRGADVNARDYYGHTALSYAEDVGDTDILSRPRKTPLTAEAIAAKKETAEVLRRHGAKK